MVAQEGVAAGRVVGAAGKLGAQALSEDSDTRGRLQEIARDSPEMRAAANAHARRVAVRQEVLLKLWKPLAKWMGVSQEYFETDFPREMAEKLAGVPQESLVDPRPSVAVPAMQGLAYSLDEPDLKDMYLNLLAQASTSEGQTKAHPSFAEIIKQVSPGEASVLLQVLHLPHQGIFQMRHKFEEDGGYKIAASHVMNLFDQATGEFFHEPLVEMWVDNWIRLGLVEVTYDEWLSGDHWYEYIDRHPVVACEQQAVPDGWVAEPQRGVLRVTGFGREFVATVGPELPSAATTQSGVGE